MSDAQLKLLLAMAALLSETNLGSAPYQTNFHARLADVLAEIRASGQDVAQFIKEETK